MFDVTKTDAANGRGQAQSHALPAINRRNLLTGMGSGGAAMLLSNCGAGGVLTHSTQIRLTMLNGMAGRDFEMAAWRHIELGLKWLDLKDNLWGQTINNLDIARAERVMEIATSLNLGIYSLSTNLCASSIEEGEETFRKRHFSTLRHVLELATVLRPECIRLLSATARPPINVPVMQYLEESNPWVFRVYREMVDQIVRQGYRCLIENEGSFFDGVESVRRFFELLDHPREASFTWDIQNFWEAGVMPSLRVYQQLRPLIGNVHVKGGRSEDGKTLAWASSLQDASWPVAEIIQTIVTDGQVAAICLNPSHGRRETKYNDWEVAKQDVAFLRRISPILR